MRAEDLLYYQTIIFFFVYFLRTLLITGYTHLKFRKNIETFQMMTRYFLIQFFTLTPILRKKLEPKGYDFKIYRRFQQKFMVYYFVLWILLFSILFLIAKIYLHAFS
jgi:hypothetical protein